MWQPTTYVISLIINVFYLTILHSSLLHPRERLRSIVMSYVCLCLCVRQDITPEPQARSLPNLLCLLPMSMAQSSSGTLTTGRIAYRREGGDANAKRGRSVIYDCLVLQIATNNFLALFSIVLLYNWSYHRVHHF